VPGYSEHGEIILLADPLFHTSRHVHSEMLKVAHAASMSVYKKMSQHFIMQYSLYLKRDFSTFICIIGTCWSFQITSAILHGSSMFGSIRLSTVADLKQSISFWQLAICIMDCIKGQGPIQPNSRDRWQFS